MRDLILFLAQISFSWLLYVLGQDLLHFVFLTILFSWAVFVWRRDRASRRSGEVLPWLSTSELVDIVYEKHSKSKHKKRE